MGRIASSCEKPVFSAQPRIAGCEDPDCAFLLSACSFCRRRRMRRPQPRMPGAVQCDASMLRLLPLRCSADRGLGVQGCALRSRACRGLAGAGEGVQCGSVQSVAFIASALHYGAPICVLPALLPSGTPGICILQARCKGPESMTLAVEGPWSACCLLSGCLHCTGLLSAPAPSGALHGCEGAECECVQGGPLRCVASQPGTFPCGGPFCGFLQCTASSSVCKAPESPGAQHGAAQCASWSV